MKNKPFTQRFRFALQGIRIAWNSESSFRTQILLGTGTLGVLIYFRPEPLWWAIFILIIGAVLAAEMINTSIEKMLDLLHPEEHPLIAQAKDCAAGAVLILSLCAIGVMMAFLYSR